MPGTAGGVTDVPLTTEYCVAWPGTFVARTYVVTLATAFQRRLSPETVITGAACGSGLGALAG